jgi:hypothetical protein
MQNVLPALSGNSSLVELADEYLEYIPIQRVVRSSAIVEALKSVLSGNHAYGSSILLRPWINRMIEVRTSSPLFASNEGRYREFLEVFQRRIQDRIQSLSAQSEPQAHPPLGIPDSSPYSVDTRTRTLRLTDPGLGEDEDFLLSLVQEDPLVLANASPSLLSNHVFMISAIKRNHNALVYVHPQIKKDFSFLLSAVFTNGLALAHMDEPYRNNPDLVRAAISNNPWALFFAGDTLRQDLDFNLSIIREHPSAIRYISPPLRYDPSFLFQCAKISNGKVVIWLSNVERTSPTLMLDLGQASANSMLYIAKELKEDEQFAHDVIGIHAEAYGYLSDSLKDSDEFTHKALRKNGHVIKHLAQEKRSDRLLSLAALENTPSAINSVELVFRVESDSFIHDAAEKNGMVLGFLLPRFQSNPKIVLAAVQNKGLALRYASWELRNDPKIVYAAIAQNPEAAQFAGRTLQKDPVVKEALRGTKRSCVVA